jgi:excisionase family DNA binding protein
VKEAADAVFPFMSPKRVTETFGRPERFNDSMRELAGPAVGLSADRSSAASSCLVLLTVDETAHLLRTTRKAAYALIERRQIPGVTRLGRRVLVRRDELLDWLRQKSECHR